MPRHPRDPSIVVEVVRRYTRDLTPMAIIAADLHITRMAVWKTLHSAGVDSSRGVASQIHTHCDHCGKPLDRVRCQYRMRTRHFCNRTCYFSFVNTKIPGTFISNRSGSRLARNVVKRHYQLSLGQIIHHIDKNQTNNKPENLAVFASARDHLRFHRGFNIAPVWSGAAITQPRASADHSPQ